MTTEGTRSATNRRPAWLERLDQGAVFVLDAAMATRLMARGLNLQDDSPALWNLKHPETVEAIHADDLEAGADVLVTNTFSANRGHLERFGISEVSAVNRQAVALARRAGEHARRPFLLFGSIGPSVGVGKLDCLEEQAAILESEGVDALLFETFRFDDAVKILERVGPRTNLPMIVSLYDWTEPFDRQAKGLEAAGASVIGANCLSDLDRIAGLAEAIRRSTGVPILLKPSGGLPHEPPASPERFGEAARGWIEAGAGLIGGCCGTTHEHLAAIRRVCYPELAEG